ncbi:MAG: glycerophosphodiester phosphodiesterase family protein [Eubacteriales bacterium]|jgi:glycerophosphoryl diester phosphodiesterase
MGNKGAKKILGAIVTAAAAWTAAVMPRLFNKPDLSDLRRYDYANRGFTGSDPKVPENSGTAFRNAIDHGYGIRMDVRMTRDGVPVIFADTRLERLTGASGSVENSTVEELKALKLSGTDEEILTLSEALKIVDGQVPVILELEVEDGNYDGLCDEVCEIVDEYEGVFAIESMDARVLRWFRKQRAEYVRGQQTDFTYRSGTSFMSRVCDFLTSSLLLDFLTAPDYIAAPVSQTNVSLGLCRAVYRVPVVRGTVRSLEDYESAKTSGASVVFEYIEP